jgi:archaellum biogenesis ATPase FlaH
MGKIDHDILFVPLVSGYGQTHSDKFKPFTSIYLNDIRVLVDNPQAVDKAKAQWLIPSTIASRTFKEQEKNGSYYLLWADLDSDPKPLSELSAFIASLLIGSNYEVYASRSAKPNYQKGRVLIPLDKPLSFSDWHICQKILNEKLNANGFTPDPANLRAAQLCYLPNRGEFYESYSQREGFIFNPMLAWGDEIAAMRQAQITRTAELESLSKDAKARREALSLSDQLDTIGVFNDAYSVQEILTMAGYDQHGNTFRHPHSESGSYSASVKNNRVHTLSTADPLYTDGKGAHDAFSAFKVLFANGNESQALKLAGDDWLNIGGESYNKLKQREINQVDKRLQAIDINDLDGFSLDQFALNGSSTEMKTQMLTDRFILDGIAILGQATVIYAPPNAGKTLLTIWLLIDAIKKGNLDPADIFYINADDTYQGLTTKLELAEKYKFKMLCPGHNGFKANDFNKHLNALVANNTASGKVLILDTLKKFVDPMEKKLSSEFMEVVRNFISHKGSVILLAHVNKHRSDQGKVIAAGTSDITDDADCAYTLDAIKNGNQYTAKFENSKSRGDVLPEVSYSYTREIGQDYEALLNSVRLVSDDEAELAKKLRDAELSLKDNADAIAAIIAVINSGINTKTELINEAKTRSGISRKTIIKVLETHTGDNYMQGHRFGLTIVRNDNKHLYSVLPLLGIDLSDKAPTP